MKTTRIITGVLVVFVFLTPKAFADANTVGTKATASLASSCQIAAQNVNFGPINLMAAGSPQYATANMTLYCTKGTAYTVSLNSVYNNNDYLSKGALGDWYRILNGVSCGSSYCTGNKTAPDGNPYYYPASYKPAANGWVYDTSTKTYYAAAGVMTGASLGDKIAYSISLPGNDSVTWDSSTGHTYTNQGIGREQTVPIKATAQTGINGSLYPAPDNYSATVTATVSY